jgi:hypothetical protein
MKMKYSGADVIIRAAKAPGHLPSAALHTAVKIVSNAKHLAISYERITTKL